VAFCLGCHSCAHCLVAIHRAAWASPIKKIKNLCSINVALINWFPRNQLNQTTAHSVLGIFASAGGKAAHAVKQRLMKNVRRLDLGRVAQIGKFDQTAAGKAAHRGFG
jgi:hypothetical protein